MTDDYILIRKQKMTELERASVPLLKEMKKHQDEIDRIKDKLSSLYTRHAKLELDLLQYEDAKKKR